MTRAFLTSRATLIGRNRAPLPQRRVDVCSFAPFPSIGARRTAAILQTVTALVQLFVRMNWPVMPAFVATPADDDGATANARGQRHAARSKTEQAMAGDDIRGHEPCPSFPVPHSVTPSGPISCSLWRARFAFTSSALT